MYSVLILLLICIASALFITGLNKHKWTLMISGIGLAIFTGIFFWFLSFWAEVLWFESVGYSHRLWKVILTKTGLFVFGAVVGLIIMTALTWQIPKKNWLLKNISKILVIYITGKWTMVNWDKILLFLNRAPTDVTDPILGKSVGFYFFILPLYNSAYGLFLSLTIIAVITSIISIFIKFNGAEIKLHSLRTIGSYDSKQYNPFYFTVGCFLFVLAWGTYLDRYNLMYSSLGVVTGPGWTDANVRMPLYLLTFILTIASGLFLIIPRLRQLLTKLLSFFEFNHFVKPFSPVAAMAVVIIISWFIFLTLVPGLFQWLKVQPNEITLEKPYIKHNIDFTLKGFGLNDIEEKRFPDSDTFNEQMIEQNANVFDNIRVWDWRALDSVYKQFQEIRLYYEFSDVDIDRYKIQDKLSQVMVSAREIQLKNVPAQSQTFVNRRFKYTHGNGLTLTKVSEFTPEGLPDLLIKDIPPKSKYPELDVNQPRIYYGELTDSHVIVNTKEKELDYPSGDENIYNNYDGTGGVKISNIWRKFLFGFKFDGTRFFLSSYPTKESRIMFNRKITDRVKKIVPFLKFDDDPYVVLANSKLYWIIDAYVVSTDYPYSEPTSIFSGLESFTKNTQFGRRKDLRGINYIRNSVKAVVDAYNGTVSFYIFEENDPLIKTWSKIFPNLFKKQDQMPDELLSHIRYPADMLLTQGIVYSKYHMTDPAVFYNQEDLWVRATEKYYDSEEHVEPYYIIWEMPDSNEPQFVLMMPFTPKDKQVLIGWIAGMCDPENYGRLLAYKFPKEKRALGTQQVETKIDQDRVLSGQLSLWDQRGSRVIRGNVLVIPIEDTIIYVEPIYLQAETAAYPELRLVAVMHNDNLSYANTFDEALYGLIGQEKPSLASEEIITSDRSTREMITQANEAFENYLDALGNKNFEDASKYLETLSQTLQELTNTQTENQIRE